MTRPDDPRLLADTRRALLAVAVIVRHLRARRQAIHDCLDRTGWQWDPEASRELDAVDEALVRIGAFDTK